MNIVVIDGYVLNPGDLSWGELEKLGACQLYDRTAEDQVIQRVRDAEVVITNKVTFNQQRILQLPRLRYIGVSATGYNIIDMAAADARGITVTNVPDYSTYSVAQMTLALLLELTNHVALHSASVHEGEWSASLDFCYWKRQLIELDDLTIGIVGFGNIGKIVANLALALGMQVLVYTRTPRAAQPGLSFVDLEVLLRQSDVVSLHCPLTPETTHLINDKTLSLMKPSALLVNTSRGGLVHEPALAAALNAGRIAGAGLDVLDKEPPDENNPLIQAKNCIITPHIAWASKAARERLLDKVVSNLASFLSGNVQNCVNRC
ncbi:MAG TPA: D-2-hydroxyacid dehydrogenase [Gammaproteobacteria bacterium]|nr:D-2-hydroxyacid dehydrogenase [Gammaproteobacteria bacterium]